MGDSRLDTNSCAASVGDNRVDTDSYGASVGDNREGACQLRVIVWMMIIMHVTLTAVVASVGDSREEDTDSCGLMCVRWSIVR